MELYIDVVFLVCLGMNAFLLWAAGRVAGFLTGKRRLFYGSLLTSLLYCLWLCIGGIGNGFLLSFLLLGTGLFVSYYPKQGRNWLRLFSSAWAVSFLMGGCVSVLFTMTQAQRFFGKGMVLQKAFPWWLLLWASGVAYGALKLSAKWLEANILRRREYCTAAILFRGRGVEGRMLIDTGNGLQEKGRGVAVVQMSVLLPLFSAAEQVRILSGERNGLEWMSYTSLGNPDGKLYGIRAEKLILSFGEKQIVHKNIFVGINEMEFTGAYEGLVPPCLLEEEL
ncbi:MAG: sigma-E processing peptidase SpoIIGA [Anaerotignum sp.]|nr:sigma-E processing peptidase SpoIIGA [Anaerotignum sp.]MBQ7104149.1 sigma-E processing peptidase SpoIIGA [Anaerotignum sp.]